MNKMNKLEIKSNKSMMKSIELDMQIKAIYIKIL